MEVDDIQQASKYSRVNSNAKINSSNIATGGQDESGGGTNNSCQPVVPTTTTTTNAAMVNGSGGGVGGEMGATGSSNRFGRQWQHSSRIIRVSRASGGKDRHSKVWTAKGPRDRRVRLSVNTAIEFYDLQDRLGYDQPSKAVEWLINAAADAINELPSLNTSSFPPETPRELTDDRRVSTNMVEMDVDGLGQNQQQMGSKSGCSSNNSENSKGSAGGLSLSQKEIRNKARERARERTAKEKERDGEPSRVNVVNDSQHLNQHQLNVNSMAPQTSSFTQLLTGRLSNLNENNNGGGSSTPSPHGSGEVVGLFSKQSRGNNQWLPSASTTTSSMADYFGAGLMSLSSSRVGQIQLGSNHPQGPQVMTLTSFGGSENQHHHEQHFPFVSDHHPHLIQVANPTTSGASGNYYNLNFTMGSSTTATPSLTASGFNNRGTLQSNSPSLVMPYLQRYSADGSGLPFFLGSAASVSSTSPTVENHHHQQFQPPGLQLCYGDNGARQTDHKGKGKN